MRGESDAPDRLDHERPDGSDARDVAHGGVADEEELPRRHLVERGAYPSTINYHGYPKAGCTSVNEVICHGIPGERVLKDGEFTPA